MPNEIIHNLLEWIEVAAVGLELLAVIIIVVAALLSTFNFIRSYVTRQPMLASYHAYKVQLGRGLLLGLEMLVAADVVRTVALETSLNSIIFLGLLVLIRTFLSWSLTLEIEHRWPWQHPPN
ncbi:DUF1622 domain-containing protein [Candidatus Viridilinea mediisalina]|uniref:DUF1622 domain-containing protein n=1 Tax=Candidatus Viridilinea mediisalina TaxID=2024553 RepID=A0A2A6RFI2_9CHLR|nr:DUF1622 domain-containing protein [Candidatus Viridilinea mediisalina]PDW01610.1 hypothetical protein CJ255_18205 [Candidatus Viridilinea mediisalina]